MAVNKISGLRYREETQRGFDILTNNKLDGAGITYKMEKVSGSGPVKAWNQVLYNSNENDAREE